MTMMKVCDRHAQSRGKQREKTHFKSCLDDRMHVSTTMLPSCTTDIYICMYQ